MGEAKFLVKRDSSMSKVKRLPDLSKKKKKVKRLPEGLASISRDYLLMNYTGFRNASKAILFLDLR